MFTRPNSACCVQLSATVSNCVAVCQCVAVASGECAIDGGAFLLKRGLLSN